MGYITRSRSEAGELENDLFEVSGLELMRLYVFSSATFEAAALTLRTR